jgi:hypothetical protein
MTPYHPLPAPGVRVAPEDIQRDVAQMHRDAFAYAPSAQLVEAGIPYPAPGVDGPLVGSVRGEGGTGWAGAHSMPVPVRSAVAAAGESYAGGMSSGSVGGFGGCGFRNRGSGTMVFTRSQGDSGSGDGLGDGPGAPGGGGGRGPGPPPFRGGG